MIKKILLVTILAIAVVFYMRFFTGGAEDSWICENSKWVKHGNPSQPMPIATCGKIPEVSEVGTIATTTEVTTIEATAADESCTDKDSGKSILYSEARTIAEAGQCVAEGGLLEKHWCNEITGTLWIQSAIKKEGCMPACVVSVKDKTSEINWMCTGLKIPE